MQNKTGKISVHTENIFPIIKKFLYSDHEIFLRELVSNAVDACQKLKTLSSIGEANMGDAPLKVSVHIDKENKTLTIRDNGIGMSAEEIEQYINQLAFSGAEALASMTKQVKDDILKQVMDKIGTLRASTDGELKQNTGVLPRQ
jgi:molecular chaperone HtpG